MPLYLSAQWSYPALIRVTAHGGLPQLADHPVWIDRDHDRLHWRPDCPVAAPSYTPLERSDLVTVATTDDRDLVTPCEDCADAATPIADAAGLSDVDGSAWIASTEAWLEYDYFAGAVDRHIRLSAALVVHDTLALSAAAYQVATGSLRRRVEDALARDIAAGVRRQALLESAASAVNARVLYDDGPERGTLVSGWGFTDGDVALAAAYSKWVYDREHATHAAGPQPATDAELDAWFARVTTRREWVLLPDPRESLAGSALLAADQVTVLTGTGTGVLARIPSLLLPPPRVRETAVLVSLVPDAGYALVDMVAAVGLRSAEVPLADTLQALAATRT